MLCSGLQWQRADVPELRHPGANTDSLGKGVCCRDELNSLQKGAGELRRRIDGGTDARRVSCGGLDNIQICYDWHKGSKDFRALQ